MLSIILKSLRCLSVCLFVCPGWGGPEGGPGGVRGGFGVGPGEVRGGSKGGPRVSLEWVRGEVRGVRGGGPRAGSMGVVITTAEGLLRRNAEGGQRPLGVCLSSPYAECRAVVNIALATHRTVMHRVLLFHDYLYRFDQKMLHSDWYILFVYFENLSDITQIKQHAQ